jgi:hypothetical protein
LTFLHAAVWRGRHVLVAQLCNAGADAKLQDVTGRSALALALELQDNQSIAILDKEKEHPDNHVLSTDKEPSDIIVNMQEIDSKEIDLESIEDDSLPDLMFLRSDKELAPSMYRGKDGIQ